MKSYLTALDDGSFMRVQYGSKINGLLVEKDNVNDLRNKMKYIYINNRNYNSVEIRENCINNFSENSVCKKIIDLYITLLKEK